MTLRAPTLPKLPGVYMFKDDVGRILYVGKAKNLSSRVASYFSAAKILQEKLRALLQEATNIEHIVTHSEHDALLLEEYLVKLYQPLYNVLLTSGEPFLYLVITDDPVAELRIARTRDESGRYFGPFSQRRVVRHVYDYLMKRFRLYRCSVVMPNGCLRYHLGICSGVCTGSFDAEAYQTRLLLVRQLLEGDTEAFRETLTRAIEHCNAQLKFEEARQLHEYAHDLDIIFEHMARSYGPAHYTHEVAHAVALPAGTAAQPYTLYDDAELALQQLLATDASLATIDCFDVSHVQGNYMVGSCIRFTRGIPERKKFRRFRIKTVEGQNDYAALQEIVSRRYKNPADIPDVVLIDGGKGQLSAVQSVLPQARVIALAKREERLFGTVQRDGVVLQAGSPLGRLLIALRDYAHRFAVAYHTLLKKKGIHGAKKS